MMFNTFAGNETLKRQAAGFIAGSRFPHAILIEGAKGSGRGTFARLLAQAMLCAGDEKPCGVCSHCRKITSGSHPDVMEITKPKDKAAIPVDDVRAFRDKAYVMPHEGSHRVFIVRDAENLNEAGQNALLKVIEEPPAHAVFILTCENRAALLATILSRVTLLQTMPVTEEHALPILRAADSAVSDAEWENALRVFGGNIGQTLAGVKDGAFRRALDIADEISEAMIAPSEMSLLKAISPLENEKEAVGEVLTALLLTVRDALNIRAGGTASLSALPKRAENLANRLTKRQLMKTVDEIVALQKMRERYMNHTLFLTVMCAGLRRAVGR